MNFKVKVSGIPTNVKMSQLIPLFSNILSMRSNEFRIRILSSKGPVKDVILSLPSCVEAQMAQEKLDSFVYENRNMTYVFSAEMEGGYERYSKKPVAKSRFNNQNRQMQNRQRKEEYYRDRSRSPQYEDTSSQLDMQLEILRKQRMILAEERKLMEEQQKLNELKMRSYNNETPSSVMTTYEDVDGSEMSSNSSKKFKQPTFYQASEVLIKRMKMFINKHPSLEDRKALIMHVRSIIKQRMATLVEEEGRGTYQTHKVIKLYRSAYPPSEDEELVNCALKEVKGGLWTADTENDQVAPKRATAKNKPDGTESAADKHKLQKGEETKDTTQTGDSVNVAEKNSKKFVEKRLFFFKSSAALIRKMHYLMEEYSPPETRKLLVEYLRHTLKQQLAAVVGDQPIYQTHKILNLYREQHPPEKDAELLKQLALDIAEGRVPEEVLIKCNQVKGKTVTGKNSGSTIDNKTQEETQNIEDGTDKSGQPEDKEGADASKNTENEGDIEKNTDDNIQPAVENQDKEENKVGSKEEIALDMKNADKGCDNMENNSTDGLVNNKTESDTSKADNLEMDNDTKSDVTVKEVIQSSPDDVKVNEEGHGIKRKADEYESSPDDVKVNEEGHGIKRKADEDESSPDVKVNEEGHGIKRKADEDESSPDDVKINEEGHGIKRKADDDDDEISFIKVLKTDDVTVIDLDDTIEEDIDDNN